MSAPQQGMASLMSAVIDSLTEPILVADTEHVVRYMNQAAVKHYTGGSSLLGTSLLDCHNEHSNAVILETLEAFRKGETERLISESPERRIYMRVVRDADGGVVGYYERYERPGCDGPAGEHPSLEADGS